MQIRERKSTWALIRTEYDKDKKRGVSRCLGTVSKLATTIPAALAGELIEYEKVQLEKVLREASVERARIASEASAKSLPETLDQVTAWYLDLSVGTTALPDLAERTRAAYSKLLKAMAQAGVGRKRRAKAKLAAAAAQKDNTAKGKAQSRTRCREYCDLGTDLPPI